MTRLLTICLLTASLSGCATLRSWFGSKDAPIVQPPGPTDEAAVKRVGQDIEVRSNKVAAAVTVAKENAANPAIVQAEAGVALSYLPTPNADDLAVARARASGTPDPKTYQAASEAGRTLQAKIASDLTKALADQKAALEASKAKDARIVELEKDIERVKKEASKNIWTLTGAALAVIGAVAFAFSGPRVGIPLVLCGAFCGSFPFIFDSPYFIAVTVGTAAIAFGLGLWWLWDKVHDSIQDKKDEQDLLKDDEDQPTPAPDEAPK